MLKLMRFLRLLMQFRVLSTSLLVTSVSLCVLNVTFAQSASAEDGTEWYERFAQPGHSLKILPTGAELTRARLELIERAQKTIYLSTYMFLPDEAGYELLAKLCEKAQKGIDVRLLVDSYGSKPLRKLKYVENIRSCGIRLMFFNPPRWGLLEIPYALHEKLLVIDGTTLLMGGDGVGRQYKAASRDSNVWHDLDLQVTGPAACWFHKRFIETWTTSTNRTIDSERDLGSSSGTADTPYTRKEPFTPEELDQLFGIDQMQSCEPVQGGNSRLLPLIGNPLFKTERPLLEAHLAAVKASKKEIRLYAPYFIPHEKFTEALLDARKRGVEVTVLTNSPASNDEKGTIMIGMFYKVRQLLNAGVKIRLWQKPSTLHRKGGVYDGRWAYFGSDNLDRRAQEYSSESLAFTDDPEIIRQMQSELDQDIPFTEPVTNQFIEKYLEGSSFWSKLITKLIVNYM